MIWVGRLYVWVWLIGWCDCLAWWSSFVWWCASLVLFDLVYRAYLINAPTSGTTCALYRHNLDC